MTAANECRVDGNEARRHTIGQVVVDRIILGRELLEEQLGEVRDTRIGVLDALCHLSKLSLYLDHAVQDQVR